MAQMTTALNDKVLALRAQLAAMQSNAQKYSPDLLVMSEGGVPFGPQLEEATKDIVFKLLEVAKCVDNLLEDAQQLPTVTEDSIRSLIKSLGEPLSGLHKLLKDDESENSWKQVPELWRPLHNLAERISNKKIPGHLPESHTEVLKKSVAELAPLSKELLLLGTQHKVIQQEGEIASLLREQNHFEARVNGLESADNEKQETQSRFEERLEEQQGVLQAALESVKTKQTQLELSTNAAATSTLTRSYKKFAKTHLVSHYIFLAATVLVIAAIAVFGVMTSMHVAQKSAIATDWPTLIWHLAVVAGGASIATYFGRQAANHRSLLNWASSIEVQLRTFEAYTSSVEGSEQQNVIRAEFARRVFGPQPEPGTKDTQTGESVGTAQLLELIARLFRPEAKSSD